MLKIKGLPFWVLLLTSTGLFACLFPFFKHQLNPDAVAYIAIAEKYASGNFQAAFSGYWSPLISWLLAPFLIIGVPAITAFKIINHIAAIFVASKCLRIFPELRSGTLLPFVISQTVYITAMMHGICSSTPDVVSAALVIQVLLLLQQLMVKSENKTISILAGIISAIAFYAKHYNLAGCSILYLLTFLFLLKQKDIKPKITALAGSYLLFIVLCLPWAFLNLQNNQKFTFSTAGTFNMSMLRQAHMPQPGQEGNHLLNLPYHTFTYASIENPLTYAVSKWTPFDDFSSFKTYIGFNVPKNIWHTLQFLAHLLFLFMVLWVMLRSRLIEKWRHASFQLLSAFLYPALYMLIVSEYRYLITSEIIAITFLFYLAAGAGKTVYPVFLGVLLSSFALYRIIDYPNKGEETFATAENILSAEPLEDKAFTSSPSVWNQSVSIAFFTGAKFFDSLKPDLLKENAGALKERQILYYFCTQKELATIGLTYRIIAENKETVFIKWQ